MIFKHKSTEEGDVTRSYLLWFEDGEENEYSVGVTTSEYSINSDFEEITNIEFLDGSGNLNKEQREEIESWIYNRDKLTEITE
jgi:hypothetical protein